jgi:Protein of unknown function (DUF1761)
MLSVNPLAVIVGAIIMMVIGWLWYGPVLGKQWVASMGWTPEAMQEKMKKGMGVSYLIMFIGALLLSYVLYRAVGYGEVYRGFSPINAGLSYSIANWLGFVAPATVGGVLWEGKSWKWWFITAGYFLVVMIILGVIFAYWM